jgi:hypothetical protein
MREKQDNSLMKHATNLEHRASSSRSKHEGESSLGLCDRLDRTRDNSQRQLPTDHDYAVPTREWRRLTRSFHIRPMHSSSRLFAYLSGKLPINRLFGPLEAGSSIPHLQIAENRSIPLRKGEDIGCLVQKHLPWKDAAIVLRNQYMLALRPDA